MNEEQQFKQQAWVNGLAHLNIQNAAAFVELAANIEETWRAKNEKSFFDKALDQIDNGFGAVGEKLGYDKRAAWKRENQSFEGIEWDWAPKKDQKAWYWDIEGRLREYTGRKTWVDSLGRSFPTKEMAVKWKAEMDSTVPHDNIGGYEVTKPVNQWRPETGATYWVVVGNGVEQSTLWIDSALDREYFEMGNCFPTKQEALAARERVKAALQGE